MTTLKSIEISPEDYQDKDIEIISDILIDLLRENHDIEVDSLSFSIDVSYTEAE